MERESQRCSLPWQRISGLSCNQKVCRPVYNMRTLKYQSKEAQIRIARETQEIYCPIAQRLGISKIKIELDDLSLKYLEPEVADLVRRRLTSVE